MPSTVQTPVPRASRTRRAVLVAWLPVVAWAALIFGLSAQPNLRFVDDAGLDFVVRKLGHMGVFGILALLLWRGLARTTGVPEPWAWAIVLTVLYAISDEIHQGTVVGRHPALLDVAIDTTGAILFVAAAWLVVQRRRRGAARPEPPAEPLG